MSTRIAADRVDARHCTGARSAPPRVDVVMDMGFPQAPLAARRRLGAKHCDSPTTSAIRPVHPRESGPPQAECRRALLRQVLTPPPIGCSFGALLARYFEAIAPTRRMPRGAGFLTGPTPASSGHGATIRRHASAGSGGWRKVHRGHRGHINSIRASICLGWDLAARSHSFRPTADRGHRRGLGTREPVPKPTRPLGLGDRLRLVGRVPHEEVPLW